MSKSSRIPRRRPPVLRRKNMVMDQRKLDAAKLALGVTTETAAVDVALDLVTFRSEVFSAIDRLAAEGGLELPRSPRPRR